MIFRGFRQPRVQVSLFARSDTGRARDHNEDRFLVADLSRRILGLVPEVLDHVVGKKGTLLVVADGMGGAAAGEVASDLAVGTIYNHLVEHWVEDRPSTPGQLTSHLREAILEANTVIHDASRKEENLAGMGTTVTAAAVLGPTVVLAQVGDSRGYLLRDGTCTQLTRDQSLIRQLVDSGQLTQAEAERAPGRNVILQALGPSPSVEVELTQERLRERDTLLLCSDGLSGVVTSEEMAETSARSLDPAAVCDDLIELANSRGGPDNITVILARLEGPGLRP